jgi:hypothetical protein
MYRAKKSGDQKLGSAVVCCLRQFVLQQCLLSPGSVHILNGFRQCGRNSAASSPRQSNGSCHRRCLDHQAHDQVYFRSSWSHRSEYVRFMGVWATERRHRKYEMQKEMNMHLAVSHWLRGILKYSLLSSSASNSSCCDLSYHAADRSFCRLLVRNKPNRIRPDAHSRVSLAVRRGQLIQARSTEAQQLRRKQQGTRDLPASAFDRTGSMVPLKGSRHGSHDTEAVRVTASYAISIYLGRTFRSNNQIIPNYTSPISPARRLHSLTFLIASPISSCSACRSVKHHILDCVFAKPTIFSYHLFFVADFSCCLYGYIGPSV